MKLILITSLLSLSLFANVFEASGETQFTFYGAHEVASSNAIQNAENFCRSGAKRVSKWEESYYVRTITSPYCKYGECSSSYRVLKMKAQFQCI